MTKVRGTRAAARYLHCSLTTIQRLTLAGTLTPVDVIEIADNKIQYVFDSTNLDNAKPFLRGKGRPKKSITPES